MNINLELLKQSNLLSDFNDSQLNQFLEKSKLLSFKNDETIYEVDSIEHNGIFLILEGTINLYRSNQNTTSDNIYSQISSGDIFNEFSILYENKTSFKAVAHENSKLLFISKIDFLNICESNVNSKKNFHDKTSKSYNKLVITKIFNDNYGKNLSLNVINQIISVGQFITLENNDVLFNQDDDSNAIYILINGMLNVFIDSDAFKKQIATIHNGEIIGEMGIISDQKRTASIYASRNSLLFKIEKDEFLKILTDFPSILMQITNQIIDRLIKQQTGSNYDKVNIFSLINLSKEYHDGDNFIQIEKEFNHSINKISSSYILNSKKASELLNIKNINDELELVDRFYPLENLLQQISVDNRYIILTCDSDFSAWSKWCVATSERQMYFVNNIEGITNHQFFEDLKIFESKIPDFLVSDKDLVIYHNSRQQNPSNTIELMKTLNDTKRHYHIAVDYKTDFNRLARSVVGKNIGLCLAGGGAKGNAHIGVYKALLECEIPVDSVCGTSAGGIVASLIAAGHSVETIVSMLKESYAKKVFKEYTVPYSSLISTNKVNLDAKSLAQGLNVEDLWLPMFTCAVNITKSELTVIDRGPVWIATRATAALPAILLPVIHNDSYLVDGGLINNMPGDIMIEKYGGKLISVSVSPEEDLIAEIEEFPSQTSYFLKKNIFRRKIDDTNVPSLGTILMRSIMVGSSAKMKEVENMSDLFLNPKVDNVGMLEFDSIDDSIEIGYNYTMKKLEKFDKNNLLF